jgi:hypothetical protein
MITETNKPVQTSFRNPHTSTASLVLGDADITRLVGAEKKIASAKPYLIYR